MDRVSGRLVRVFLIADIRGYTAFTAERGDEEASRLAARFAEMVGEAAEAWAGKLLELRGDEALCVFDDPLSSMWAAVELQEAFADETAAEASLPLRTGIGLAAGDAVPLADGYRGMALNLAARLCAVSTAGEIHASRELVEGVGRVEGLRFGRVEELELKGFEGTQRAYRITRAEPHAAHPVPSPPQESETPTAETAEPDGAAQLAGRAAEMRWLQWHWRRARHGHGRVVQVEGPPGVGKTRLAAELTELARRDGATVHSQRLGSGGGEQDLGSLLREPPSLVVLDADGTSGAIATSARRAWPAIEQQHTLVVVVGDDGGVAPIVRDDGPAACPRLVVRPLDLEGVRALGAQLAPDTADELPIARIFESSGGLPGPAREVVLEWAERLEAERSAGGPAGALPADRSTFVGRVGELQTARALLERSRVLTLTGPPGTGKTRLALQLARSAAADYPDGTCFVSLAAVRDETLLASAIARALQLRVGPEVTALDVVEAYLAERRTLLVLDNFEQLQDAAGDVGRLLAAASDLRVLVTSRSSLELSGEQVYPVPPLEVSPEGAVSVEEVASADACALFVQRARSVDPEFDLRPENAAVVAAIVARLEGLPLAIELAAARVRTLGVHELLEHLQQRLPLLTGGRADEVEHHQTMRDAIAWSYELLDPEEQRLLRHLSVFRGGFALEAVSQVADRSEVETLDTIDALVMRSLVTRVGDRPHTRFGLLELIREFAAQELADRGEEPPAITRHIAVQVALVRELEPIFEGSESSAATEHLGLEIDNLRAALEHATATRDVEAGLALAACPWRFWQSIGQLAEGRSWVERALELPGGSVPARARATAALGGLCYWLGDFDGARESYLRARDLYTATGDRTAEANAIYSLSLVATYEGDLNAADRYADEAMELARAVGDEAMIAEVLAAQFLVAWKRGELARARGLGEAALEIALRLELSAMIATQLVGLAGVSHVEGDDEQALRRAGEALDLTVETENTHTRIFALDAIASFAATRWPVPAVQLCSAAAALRVEHGGGWTLTVMGVECADEAARVALDGDELEDARASGSGLDLDEATEVARAILARASERRGRDG